MVGSSEHVGCGESAGGVEAHACGAASGASGVADSGANGGVEDRCTGGEASSEPLRSCSNMALNFRLRKPSKILICCGKKLAMALRTIGLYENCQ